MPKKTNKFHIFRFSPTFDMPYLVGLDSVGQGGGGWDGKGLDVVQ